MFTFVIQYCNVIEELTVTTRSQNIFKHPMPPLAGRYDAHHGVQILHVTAVLRPPTPRVARQFDDNAWIDTGEEEV